MTFTVDQVTALVVAVTALVAALGAIYNQVRKTHLVVNSRMDQMLAITQQLGVQQGRSDKAVPPLPPAPGA